MFIGSPSFSSCLGACAWSMTSWNNSLLWAVANLQVTGPMRAINAGIPSVLKNRTFRLSTLSDLFLGYHGMPFPHQSDSFNVSHAEVRRVRSILPTSNFCRRLFLSSFDVNLLVTGEPLSARKFSSKEGHQYHPCPNCISFSTWQFLMHHCCAKGRCQHFCSFSFLLKADCSLLTMHGLGCCVYGKWIAGRVCRRCCPETTSGCS